MNNRIIIDHQLMQLMLERFSNQLIENYGDFSDTAIIGVQPRGVLFSDKIHKYLVNSTQSHILYGQLDITFYRDDFKSKGVQLEAKATNIDFSLTGKRIILIDDVLYTGRTIRAALDAMLAHGRPSEVKLLTLINRRFNRELPIQPDFIGKTVDTQMGEVVSVQWDTQENGSHVILLKENL
ncbi:MAG: bifunctional pyr operon transcriptional regulator/uracil phosphoribosyltransferase PyrR [Chitinophagales bacterium]|nr:bifunctional pyr operon transcriptional regulator/uracil phosphoribosyltransferase PyrR [Chitinophagales bacterium]MCZ2393463.1 bifunctional pyr operon transcriptional regulator/uracil phosphoribosyltransferase PyrR [Chitinophagales bacterium]